MKRNLAFLAVIAAVLITSGCIDALDQESYDEETIEELEELEQQQEEDAEETEQEETYDSETEEDESYGAERTDDYENGSETEESDSADDEADTQIEVTGGNHYFEEDEIEVEEGETVEIIFENEGGNHDLVIPELDVGTEVIDDGETDSFTYTFDEEGEYDFECSVGTHAEQGMTGTITVA